MMNLWKAMTAMVVVAAMAGSQAMAADGALAPGKPAGVQEARIIRHTKKFLLIGGVGVAVALVGIVAAMNSSSGGVCDAAHCPNTAVPSTPSTP